MITLSNFIGHLKTILNHKRLVRHYCFKAGLYRQGIMHDWSKYTPIEFISGVKYYQGGKRSPNAKEKKLYGYSPAWLHHKGRNKHHFEYWIDYENETHTLAGMKMPKRYVVEMFCDRISASKNYNPDTYTDNMPLDYFNMLQSYYTIHPDSKKLLLLLLTMLSEKGEDYTFRFIRKKVLKNKSSFMKKWLHEKKQFGNKKQFHMEKK